MVSVIRIMQSLVSVLYNCSCIGGKRKTISFQMRHIDERDHTLT